MKIDAKALRIPVSVLLSSLLDKGTILGGVVVKAQLFFYGLYICNVFAYLHYMLMLNSLAPWRTNKNVFEIDRQDLEQGKYSFFIYV